MRAGEVLLYSAVGAESAPFVHTDGDLTAVLAERLPNAKTEIRGLMWRSIVTQPHEKARLQERYDVSAVDMESYALVTALENAGVRTTVLRVVSDGLNDELPDLNAALGKDGALRTRALVREICRSPRAGVRMMVNGARAVARLKEAVIRGVRA